MGLASGPYGPKAVLRSTFPDVMIETQSLCDAARAVHANSSQTVVIVDGNVTIRSAHMEINTLPQYVSFVQTQLRQAFAAGNHVIVVFDDPKYLTRAKAEEQAKRDATRKKAKILTSDDLGTPINDHYILSSLLLNNPNLPVRNMIDQRPARSRVMDAIVVEVFERFEREFAGALPGTPPRTLVMDGVDPRGGDRPIGMNREAGFLVSVDTLKNVFDRTNPIGEGDLKITDVTDRIDQIHRIDGTAYKGVEVVLINTIDTDSLIIETIAHSRRSTSGQAGGLEPIYVLLCLKERASTKRFLDGTQLDPSRGFYTCFDVQELHDALIDHVSGSPPDRIPPLMRRKITSLIGMGAILTGCDFHTAFKGSRFCDILEIITHICHEEPHALAGMDSAWRGDDVALLRLSAQVVELSRKSADIVNDDPRRKKHVVESLVRPLESDVLKVLWTLSYWHGKEKLNIEDWGY